MPFPFLCLLLCCVSVISAVESIDSSGQQRLQVQKEAAELPFVLLAHRANYIVLSYFDPIFDPYVNQFPDFNMDELEVNFQISIKYIAVEDVFTDDLDLEFAYTSVSWWQAFNADASSPFRETNYEPEFILNYHRPWSLGSLTIDNSYLSLNHQSNGRGGSISRSWNRLVAGGAVEHGSRTWALRTWWRFPEDAKKNPGDTQGDDNPDIEKYMGNFELSLLWDLPKDHKIDCMLRNNLRRDNKGAVELGWSFPLSGRLRGYVQYFNGYGDGMIYYSHSTERLGLGLKLTDW